jgi:type I restriction enzyme S subunit
VKVATWRLKRLDDLCEITSSKRIFAADYVTEGVPFYRGREITEKYKGNLDVSTELFISEEKFREIERKFGAPKQGDLLLTSVGTLESVYVVKPGDRFYFKDGNLTWFRNFKGLDSRFLYFWIASPQGKAELQKSTIGSSQSALTIVLLKGMEIELPPLLVQKRIAGILSAYDELIENCQRRIKILESMARAIYREWFVHFRFPGHENHPRAPSPLGEIPQGWEVKRLDEVCRSIQDGDWIETKDQGGEDYRLIQISNIGVGEFIETENFRYVTQDTYNRLHCNEIVPGDLLVARMPTPIGRGWLATKMPWRMITAVDVAIVRAAPTEVDPLFLVQAWNDSSNLQRIAAQASGTTRLRITRRELGAMEFVIPPLSVQQQFAAIVQPKSMMIEALRQQIQNLRRTRDLLLPRLLSGQIEVTLPEP